MKTAQPQSTRSRPHRGRTEGDGRERAPATGLASTIGNAGVVWLMRSGAVPGSGGTSADLDESVARAIQTRRGGGIPLSGGVRERMEGAFGEDFSRVRVHTSSDAHQFNEQVQARAFTVGNDIFFSRGAHNPGSTQGTKLLAHELAHVVQQSSARVPAPDSVSDPAEPAERHADEVAGHVLTAVTRRGPWRGAATRHDHPEAEAASATQAASPLGKQVSGSGVVRLGSATEPTPRDQTHGPPRPPVASQPSTTLLRCGAVAPEACPCHPKERSTASRRAVTVQRSAVEGPPRQDAPSVEGDPAADVPAAEGACDRPTQSRNGPGRGRERPSGVLRLLTKSLLGLRIWELYNFDVDKSFVKPQHESYIRAEVIPPLEEAIEEKNASVLVVGETSTTASQRHNLPLSRNRSACVTRVLRHELRGAGVGDLDRVLSPVGVGELPARIRKFPGDEIEDAEDRKVTIVAVPRHERTCSESVRTRPSWRFRIKTACDSPYSVAINIGDVSDPLQPTYRRFRWFPLSGEERCRFIAGFGEAAYLVRADFRLATKDPDNPFAHSDFSGQAILHAAAGSLEGARGHFWLKLDGAWDPEECRRTVGQVRGMLVPVGPPECGEVPTPATDESCDQEAAECSESDRTGAATEFAAILARGTGDISDIPWVNRIPWDLLQFSPEAGLASVTIGTLNAPGPQLTRTFLFAGAGLGGSGEGGIGAQVGVNKRAVSANPLRLAVDNPDRYLSASDFGGSLFSPPKLVIKGDNKEELHVGGVTFTFSGQFCNHSSGRTLYGIFRGVGPTWCFDLRPLTTYEPKPNCDADCPGEVQLARRRTFVFKVGRASLAGLPVAGRVLAQEYGCKVVAAYINIGALTEETDDRIFREFLFVGALGECGFDVTSQVWTDEFFLGRQLSKEDPDDRFDLSDFAGHASLDDAGTLSVTPFAAALPFSFALPGGYDPSCTGDRTAAGLIVPLDEVHCGDVPDAQHDTEADGTLLERCRAFADANTRVAVEVERLRSGDYDPYVNIVTNPPALVYPEVESLPSRVGKLVKQARLVGRSTTGPRVVTFVDMVVLDYGTDPRTGRLWVEVLFTSDPCSFNEHGDPVLVRPHDCMETLPHRGQTDTLRSVPVILDPEPESGEGVVEFA